MLTKPEACKGCPLYGNGIGYILPEGNGSLRIIGEAAGESEAKDGKPFRPYAQSGSKLEEVFRLTATTRNDFRIYNVLACRPPSNKLEGMPYEFEAIARCRTNLEKVVPPNGELTSLALGWIALRTLAEIPDKAYKLNLSNLRGFVLESRYGKVIGSYHPSFIRRGKPNFTQYLVWDLQKAIRVQKHGFTKPAYKFVQDANIVQVKEFYYRVKNSPQALLAFDIETDDSLDTEEDERVNLCSKTITRIQFSISKDEAISFAFTETYLPAIKLLFMLPNPKIGHNCYTFDIPRLKDKGILINGIVYDSMLMFKHCFPGLERALQKVASCANYPEPWKHLSASNLGLYGCHDVNALHYIYEWLRPLMEREGIWC
jgi:uracil-DNA glycosylase family 4